jgi:hypothetical protein
MTRVSLLNLRGATLTLAIVMGASSTAVGQDSTSRTRADGVSANVTSRKPSARYAHVQTDSTFPSAFRDQRWAVGVKGAIIGAVAGAVVSGTLSRGACERSPCGNVGRDAVSGALVGAALGALVEIVVRRR